MLVFAPLVFSLDNFFSEILGFFLVRYPNKRKCIINNKNVNRKIKLEDYVSGKTI